MKNWGDSTATSERLAAQEIKRAFDEGDLADVEAGVNQRIETMARSEKRALQSQLIRLIMHVIKGHVQPEKRSRSWLITLTNARYEIAGLREYTPSLNEIFIYKIWEKSMKQARTEAQIDTGVASNDVALTWEEVFDTQYTL